MKFSRLVGLSSALALSAMPLVAQEANPAAFSKQLEALLRVQKQQAEQKPKPQQGGEKPDQPQDPKQKPSPGQGNPDQNQPPQQQQGQQAGKQEQDWEQSTVHGHIYP